MGGSGSIRQTFASMTLYTDPPMPYAQTPRPVLIYALVTMGYHFADQVNSAFFRERASDFWEMQLHHLATVSLYFCMIYGNNMGIGCTIAFLHDIADIFACLAKCASTMEDGTSVVVTIILTMVTWAWTRLYILPQFIYEIFAAKDIYPDSLTSSFCLINGFFLCIL